MKFTLNWLKDHLQTNASLNEITECLNQIGLEVEEVIDLAKPLKDFVVAEVLATKPHPDANKLQICTINNGTNTREVVCGAPNARAGIKVVFAESGQYIPGLDIVLKKAKIRGVESSGMLLSMQEMQLGDDHSGIVELVDDAQVGSPAVNYLPVNDPIIDIAITPNRGDWLGVRGVARELAAFGLGELKALEYSKPKSSFASDITISYDGDRAKHFCPQFLSREIKNITNKESPEWLKTRLKAIGINPKNALVDITNYLTFDLNRPAHFFDADKVAQNLTLRMAKKDEKILALNETEYSLDEDALVLADNDKVHAIAGIMGGLDSGCDLNTSRILIEIAIFDPTEVSYSGRKLNLTSDSRYRFERGIDRAFLNDGMEIITNLVLDICGGEASEVIELGKQPDNIPTFDYEPKSLQKIVGIHIDEGKQKEILTALGYEITEKDSNTWQIATPSWRYDDEGCAGIIEEVLRIYTLDALPEQPLPLVDNNATDLLDDMQTRCHNIRHSLAANGLNETITFSFTSQKLVSEFLGKDVELLYLSNPISNEYNVMRPTLVIDLILGMENNARMGLEQPSLFEIAPVFHGVELEQQKMMVATARSGNNFTKHWLSETRSFDCFDAKADAFNALEAIGADVQKLQVAQGALPYYHPGRSGTIMLGAKNVLGYFGELHPRLYKLFNMKQPIVISEVFVDNYPVAKKKKANQAFINYDLMPVMRDFAFVIDKDLPAEQLRKAILNADKKYITDVQIFDQFVGDSLGENKKSVAFNVFLQPIDKTFTDVELEEIQNKVIKSANKVGAELRS